MDKIMRLDGRTPEQVTYVIEWLTKDEFWAANVLSVPTLRRQFDKLVAKIKSQRGGRLPTRENSERTTDLARQAARRLEETE